jgi:hypothetical protein
MAMLVRLEQTKKAFSPITVTDEGMVVFLHPLISVLLSVCIMALQSSLESKTLLSLETEMLVRFSQTAKAHSPIFVTDGGIVMLVRLEQSEKAHFPIFVTDGGMEMLVRLEQPEKAHSPIFVTDGGMAMLVRLEQPEKASSPIFFIH